MTGRRVRQCRPTACGWRCSWSVPFAMTDQEKDAGWAQVPGLGQRLCRSGLDHRELLVHIRRIPAYEEV
jgi:hypothetical protein